MAVIGAAALDAKGFVAGRLADGEALAGQVALVPGGPALNIAANLARLGATTMLFSVVGQDFAGEMLLAHARAAGVDVSAVEQIPGVASPLQVLVGEQTPGSSYAIWSFDALEHLTPEYLDLHQAALRAATCCILAFERHVAGAFVSATSAGTIRPGVPVGLSLKASEIPYFTQHQIAADWLCLNAEEASLILERPIAGIPEAGKAAAHIRSLARGIVVLTLGEQGLVMARDGEVVHVALDPVAGRDVTGAGDAVQAGFTYRMLNGGDPLDAACFGAAAAALTVMSEHSANPALSEREVLHYLAEHPPRVTRLERPG